MPEIATYDFDVTRNEECFENIPYLDAQANDKVYMLLKQFGNLKLMKRCASYGGSEKELVISNGVGYQIKLYESETDQLEVHESLGASYTIYRVNPENESIPIVRGTITVNPRQGESVPAFRIEQRAMLYVTGTEMPDASKYPEGTVVSKNGVLYIQKSGVWEGVGGASTLSIFNAEGVALEQASAINIDFPLTLESNKIYKLFCLIYKPTLQKVNIGEGFVVRIYDSWIITNQWYRDEMGDYTFTPDESNGRIIVGSDLGDLNYQISLVPTI